MNRVVALGAVVVVNAAVQALLVAVTPPLPLEAGALLLAAVSAAVLIASVVACWRIALRDAPPRILPLVGLIAASGIIVAVAATVLPAVVPLIVAFGCAMVVGAGPRGAVALVRRSPVRWALLTVATILVVLLGWVVALFAGLFVTGAVASAVTWLVAGALALLMTHSWSTLARRLLPVATDVVG